MALLGFAAVAQPPDLNVQIHRALDRARTVLLDEVRRAQGGELALVCLALLHDRVDRRDPVLRDGLERLARANLTRTYDLALRLMVAHELADARGAAADLERLLANQIDAGGFSYTGHEPWDLSNTQYAALGLRAAHALGSEAPRVVWRRLARAVAGIQRRDGGFPYREGQRSTGSMTVAGIAVLEICRQRLGGETAGRLGLRRRIFHAWRWLARHASKLLGNARMQWSYYFHYGLERAAILSGREKVGEVDWYDVGAHMLLDQQMEDGGWHRDRAFPRARVDRSEPVGTAFAVLFLRRGFRRTLAPITPGGGVSARTLPVGADERRIDSAVAHEVARGLAAVPDLLRALRSPLPARRRAAARALARIAGRDFGYEPDAPVVSRAAAAKRAERWWLTEGRKQRERRR